MKTTTITLILLFAFAYLFSAPIKTSSSEYVETEYGIILVKSIKYGLNNFIVAKTMDGKKLTFSKSEVKSYKKDGKLYKQMLFYKNNNAVVDFLEQVSAKAGYTLYKYFCYNGCGKIATKFYLFKGEKFEKEIIELQN